MGNKKIVITLTEEEREWLERIASRAVLFAHRGVKGMPHLCVDNAAEDLKKAESFLEKVKGAYQKGTACFQGSSETPTDCHFGAALAALGLFAGRLKMSPEVLEGHLQKMVSVYARRYPREEV